MESYQVLMKIKFCMCTATHERNVGVNRVYMSCLCSAGPPSVGPLLCSHKERDDGLGRHQTDSNSCLVTPRGDDDHEVLGEDRHLGVRCSLAYPYIDVETPIKEVRNAGIMSKIQSRYRAKQRSKLPRQHVPVDVQMLES